MFHLANFIVSLDNVLFLFRFVISDLKRRKKKRKTFQSLLRNRAFFCYLNLHFRDCAEEKCTFEMCFLRQSSKLTTIAPIYLFFLCFSLIHLNFFLLRLKSQRMSPFLHDVRVSRKFPFVFVRLFQLDVSMTKVLNAFQNKRSRANV